MQNPRVKIQVQSGGFQQIFRYTFEGNDHRYQELCSFLSARSEVPPNFLLRYRDDEGEMITIASDADVAEALETADSMNSLLKIFVGSAEELNAFASITEISTERSVSLQPESFEVEEVDEPSVEAGVPVIMFDSPSSLVPEPVVKEIEQPVVVPEDPMDKVCSATEELMVQYRGRFGNYLLIELNTILQNRDIHPKNYPAEIAMIINTKNEFLEILQNPLYLDVVGPALFKIILPDEFVDRVNTTGSFLKSIDAQMVNECSETIINSLVTCASENRAKFRLRAAQPAFDFDADLAPEPPKPVEVAVAEPVEPESLDPVQPVVEEENPAQDRMNGFLGLLGWADPEPLVEEVPNVPPDAPVISPPESDRIGGEFDLLSFVDDSLDNLRDEEKASEERTGLSVTPAAHTSYNLGDEEFVEEVIEVEELDERMPDLVQSSEDRDSEHDVFSEVESLDEDDEKTLVLSASSHRVSHPDSLCSLCGMKPIRGIRYKCLVCSDMNMCAECEASGQHDRTHPVIKFSTATQKVYAPFDLSGLRDLIDPTYHHIFFTDLQSERANEDAMNMSTYSAVSAASLNPLLMMRYMAESLRNPAALSRILDPEPLREDDESLSGSEFEIEVGDEPVANGNAGEELPAVEVVEPQEDEVALDTEEEFELAPGVNPEPEVVAPEMEVEEVVEQEQEVAVAGEADEIIEQNNEEVVEEKAAPSLQEAVESKQPDPATRSMMPPYQHGQMPQYPNQQQQGPAYFNPPPALPYYAPPAQPQPYPYQQPFGYRYPQPPPQPNQYPYPPRPGMPTYQARPQPQPAVARPQLPAHPAPRPPVQKEEELDDDFVVDAEPEVEAPPPAPAAVPAAPRQPVPVSQPAKVPGVPPPAAKVYAPPIVSTLPAYPSLSRPKPEEKSAPVVAASAAPPAEVRAVAPAVESATTVEEVNALNCFCGVPLMKMPVGDLGSVVQCDMCNQRIKKGDVYHCFEAAKHGKGGYDLCLRCGEHQINASRPDRLPRTTQSGDSHVAEQVAPSAPPSAPPSASAVAAPAGKQEVPPELKAEMGYKHFGALMSLHEMGIGDVATNKKLLKIHKGNVSAVMQQYFDGNVSGYHY